MLPGFRFRITHRGYVGLVVVVFMVAFAMLIYPNVFPTQKSGGSCMAGEPPSRYEEINMIPVGADWASEEESALRTPFVLIRKNIPITTGLTAFCAQLFSPTTETCPHFSPIRMAEYPDDLIVYPRPPAEHDYINTLLQREGSFYPLQEKVIFFIHMEAMYKPKVVSLRPTIDQFGNILGYEKIISADAYQQKDKYEEVISGRAGYNYADVFQCDEDRPLPVLESQEIEEIISTPGFNDPESPVFFPELNVATFSGNILVPSQSRSQDSKQLQLEWFLFDKAQGAWGTHCKPAVYLYPEKKQLVNLRVFPKGELSYTDPPYDQTSGWFVEAYPDGSIFDLTKQESSIFNQGKKYDYLYYESKLLDSEIKKPQEGWVVQGSRIKDQGSSELERLFDEVLPKLGLNAKEKADFEEYWLNKLPEAPYYFVGLVDKQQRDYLERLSVTPEPETSIRFSLFFEMLEEPKVVREPSIGTPKREGFTLVDWGGMIKLHPGTEFTCSE